MEPLKRRVFSLMSGLTVLKKWTSPNCHQLKVSGVSWKTITSCQWITISSWIAKKGELKKKEALKKLKLKTVPKNAEENYRELQNIWEKENMNTDFLTIFSSGITTNTSCPLLMRWQRWFNSTTQNKLICWNWAIRFPTWQTDFSIHQQMLHFSHSASKTRNMITISEIGWQEDPRLFSTDMQKLAKQRLESPKMCASLLWALMRVNSTHSQWPGKCQRDSTQNGSSMTTLQSFTQKGIGGVCLSSR